MASNSFGTLFRITTWGESHGKALGVVIDGCPSGLEITEDLIYEELSKRKPGLSLYTSRRKEEDYPQILSGVFEGKTTGAPIHIMIENKDVDSTPYESLKNLLKPGHANYTYMQKYGIFDYRGGGRASARETAVRVAAGAIAKVLLMQFGIEGAAFIQQIGETKADVHTDVSHICEMKNKSVLFCPDPQAEKKMVDLLDRIKNAKDSIGGIVGYIAEGLPPGLGDPIYEKLEANLAKAMLSIPASKGFEVGEGFQVASMRGSEHNDLYTLSDGKIRTRTNHAGGTLGGISTGEALSFRVAFKPTSSIKITQPTLDFEKNVKEFQVSALERHDPCVAIRAVAVVEAMAALVIADALLMNGNYQLLKNRQYSHDSHR